MQGALEKIFEMLEKLYMESTKDSTSKYAKKRIRVDMKILLKNVETDQFLQFSPVFQHLHFNLLLSMDKDEIVENTLRCLEPTTDISRIQVVDHYSKVKQSIKNILFNRCAIK